MEPVDFAFRPRLSFLSDEGKESLHQGILELLGRVGMVVMHEGARELLEKNGCRNGEDGRLLIPAGLVDRALSSTPKRIGVFDREGEPAMELAGRNPFFGTGSDLTYRLEGDPPERRLCSLEDVKSAARVADALTGIDFIMSCAHPRETPPDLAYLESFRAMTENTTKPVVCTAKDRNDLAAMWEISAVLRGGEEALREMPFCLYYGEPSSPLKHPRESVDKLLFCAEKGLPLVYSPAPIAGSTAPMTIAGHVAQGLAECLCGMVLHQLAAPGAPFIMGMGPAVLDMATSQCSYNAPEYLMSYAAVVEMSNYYNIPNWGYAGTSDSQIPDEQAVFEGGLEVFLAAALGSNLNHDVGYLDFGQTGSLEMIVIMSEIIEQVHRFMRGAPVDEENLALSVVREAAKSMDFLGHPHTHRHFRQTQWRPRLMSRKGRSQWEQEGGLSLLERARKRLREILTEQGSPPLDRDRAGDIEKVVARFRETG